MKDFNKDYKKWENSFYCHNCGDKKYLLYERTTGSGDVYNCIGCGEKGLIFAPEPNPDDYVESFCERLNRLSLSKKKHQKYSEKIEEEIKELQDKAENYASDINAVEEMMLEELFDSYCLSGYLRNATKEYVVNYCKEEDIYLEIKTHHDNEDKECFYLYSEDITKLFPFIVNMSLDSYEITTQNVTVLENEAVRKLLDFCGEKGLLGEGYKI